MSNEIHIIDIRIDDTIKADYTIKIKKPSDIANIVHSKYEILKFAYTITCFAECAIKCKLLN